jgi:hypothetical protein
MNTQSKLVYTGMPATIDPIEYIAGMLEAILDDCSDTEPDIQQIQANAKAALDQIKRATS